MLSEGVTENVCENEGETVPLSPLRVCELENVRVGLFCECVAVWLVLLLGVSLGVSSGASDSVGKAEIDGE